MEQIKTYYDSNNKDVKNQDDNINIINNIIIEKEYFKKKYNEIKEQFYQFQLLIEPYQNGIEKKYQKFQNFKDGLLDIISELTNQMDTEKKEKMELFKQIKTIYEMIPLLKHKLETRESENKLLKLKNDELLLELQLLKEEKEKLQIKINNNNNNNNIIIVKEKDN